MALKLEDLGELGRKTLRAVADLQVGNRREIAERAGISRAQVSSALNRLENYGLVQIPMQPGGAWSITNEGQFLATGQRAALASPPPVVEPEMEAEEELESEPEAEQELEPVEEFVIPQEIIPDTSPMLRQREIEDALALVRARLRCTLLPTSAVRIHREIMNSLPAVLREELMPIELMILAASE